THLCPPCLSAVATAVDLGEPDVARRMRLLSEGLAEAENSLRSGVYVSPQLGEVEHVEPVPFKRTQRSAEEARADAETIIRNLLAMNPSMTRQELMRRGKVSMSDVDYWRHIVLEEMGYETKKPAKRKRRSA